MSCAGLIGPIILSVPRRNKEPLLVSASVAMLARREVLKRLAPEWSPFPHLRGQSTKDVLRYLIEHPEIRQKLGGPIEVDEYTLNFLDIDIPDDQ